MTIRGRRWWGATEISSSLGVAPLRILHTPNMVVHSVNYRHTVAKFLRRRGGFNGAPGSGMASRDSRILLALPGFMDLAAATLAGRAIGTWIAAATRFFYSGPNSHAFAQVPYLKKLGGLFPPLLVSANCPEGLPMCWSIQMAVSVINVDTLGNPYICILDWERLGSSNGAPNPLLVTPMGRWGFGAFPGDDGRMCRVFPGGLNRALFGGRCRSAVFGDPRATHIGTPRVAGHAATLKT